jgi:hypothetical protein
MTIRRCRPVLLWGILAVLCALTVTSQVRAQPTYKLDVKAHLKPLATLQVDGTSIRRSDVKDDPGFRLQYHFQKDGKTLATVEGRSRTTVELPGKEAGTYTVVLELFYPAYRGGTQQKGQFKPISHVLTYRIEGGAKPDDPIKVTPVETPPPAPPKK